MHVISKDGLETEGYAARSSTYAAGNVDVERIIFIDYDAGLLELRNYSLGCN